MPSDTFRQEFLAEFLDDSGAVFRRIRDAVKGDFEDPDHENKRYVLGVDLGKHVDYTVLTVLDQFGHLCYLDRFNQIDWKFQKERIIATAKRWNAQVLIDSSGLGDPIYDDLSNIIRVKGYKFTNESKRKLISNLSIALEQGKITFPDHRELISELEMFGYEITQHGNIRYGAPEGFHDDIVIALALAVWNLRHKIILRHRGSKAGDLIYG